MPPVYKNKSINNLPEEHWVTISAVEGFYQISSLGRVKSSNRTIIRKTVVGNLEYDNSFELKEKIKYQNMGNTGRLYVMLYKSSKHYKFYVSRLVAIAFHANPDNKKEVNHIDGNCLNNHKDNLEWVTKRENYDHAKISGLMARGERQAFNKLSSKSVLEIFKSSAQYKELSKKFKISISNIGYIKRGKTWGWLTKTEATENY